MQHNGWEVWTVRAVGEVLCLEADAGAARSRATLLDGIACSPVVGVDLHTRFGGVGLQHAARLRFHEASSQRKFTKLFFVTNKAVVIAGTVFDLLVVSINVLTNGLRCGEVERSSFYAADFTCRNAGVVNGNVEVAVHIEQLVFNAWRWVGNTL